MGVTTLKRNSIKLQTQGKQSHSIGQGTSSNYGCVMQNLACQKQHKDYIQNGARHTCHPEGRSLESWSKSGCLLPLFIASEDDSATSFCALLRLTRSRLSLRITITLLPKRALWIFTTIFRDVSYIRVRDRTDPIRSNLMQNNQIRIWGKKVREEGGIRSDFPIIPTIY